MNFARLQTFFDVFRSGSFAAAARQRGVDPSSMSRSVSVLEAELGVRLFNRTTRRMTPTEEGTLLHDRLSGPLDEIEGVLAEARDIREKPSGILRISASASFGAEHVVPRLPTFLAEHPDLRVDLQLTDRRVDLVEEQVDVAIRHGRLEDSELTSRKLRDVRYRVVGSSGYFAAHGLPRHPSELSEHRIVTFSYPAFRDSWTFRHAKTPQSGAVSCSFGPVLTVSSATALRDCARGGLGIAILPDWMERAGLVDALPNWDVLTGAGGALWQVTASHRYVPGRIRVWLEFMNAEMASFGVVKAFS